MGNSVKLTWHTEKRRLGDLIEWDKNPRQLKEHDAEHLKKSLDNFGVADPLIINTDNRIIGGHMRRRIMLKNGYKPDDLVDVRVPERELTEREAEELAIRLNKNTGDWDFDALANEFELDDLLEWGFDKQELDLDLWAGEPPEDVEPQIDKAEELREKWQVQTGQLWQLGEHRLICGDCTDKAVVERVMGGERAGCVFTDPPYGIDYSDLKGTFEKIAGDDKDPTELIKNSLSIIASGTHYVCCNWKSLKFITDALEEIGNSAKAVIVWDKGSRIQNLDKYGKRHEFIVYAGAYGGEKTVDDDLWQVNRETRKDHPTAKPTELIERAIKNETGIVYDPFLGSGTTLIACERLGRKCRAVEISPAYVAVAIQRWVDVTGKEPVLLSNST